MRTLSYLSPTSIAAWVEDRDSFYVRYLVEDRPPRDPQTQPMAVGSAFDAFVKDGLQKDLGLPSDFDALFETQVEEHNRDWALEAGLHVFEKYKALGAYDALLEELRQSETTPRFESEVRGLVEGVEFLGKPDAVYTKGGQTFILDWKVSGYCAKNPTSPAPGYVRVRGGRTDGQAHKGATVVDGVNTAQGLEDANEGWARQLAVYAWLLGAPVGSGFVCGIDQIVCKPTATKPEIRVAEHRYRISEVFQKRLLEIAKKIHEAVAKDHIFDDVSQEECKRRRKVLDALATSPVDPLFQLLTR